MVMAPTLGSRAGRPLQELLPDLAASLSVLYPLYPGQGQSKEQRKRPMDPREKEKTQAHPKKGAKKEGRTEGEEPVTVVTAKCKEPEIPEPKPKEPKEPKESKEKASQAKRKVDVKKPSMEGMQGIQSICSQSPSGKSLKRLSNTQSEKKSQKAQKDQKDQKDLAKLPQSREAKTKLKVQESQKAQKAKKLKTGEELKEIDSKEIGFRSAPSEKSSEVLRGARPIQSIRSMEMNVVQPASKFPMASELTIFMQNLAVRKNLRA
ncbi:unnamed protein product [Cladocopium goreaui]|uniref:Uncharacterized protein n=1 Tax=Cladocopium goreaui TaxID=2562237 RepID=A0A9P1DRI6_9DINO|nr:unnamed protein product [Cladocopium goreaui]